MEPCKIASNDQHVYELFNEYRIGKIYSFKRGAANILCIRLICSQSDEFGINGILFNLD